MTEFHTRLIKRGKRSVRIIAENMEKSQHTNFNEKIQIMKALVWPAATYGCERWTLRKNEETRLDAFEMKELRKLLPVSWTAK